MGLQGWVGPAVSDSPGYQWSDREHTNSLHRIGTGIETQILFYITQILLVTSSIK